MERITFEILNSIFSKARISPYLRDYTNAENVLARYHINIELSEAMMPTLHYFEVCLRNRIDQVIKKYYTSDWLIRIPKQLKIPIQDINKINEIILRKSISRKTLPTHDDIVAHMTFGFWCSFFQRKYDPMIWHLKESMKIVFPNIPRVNRKRAYIEPKLFKIKEMRNRIAHYEPLLNRKISILEVYNLCHEIIMGMSYEAIEMLKKVDRFITVYDKAEEQLKALSSVK
jgi:hypothetical protein